MTKNDDDTLMYNDLAEQNRIDERPEAECPDCGGYSKFVESLGPYTTRTCVVCYNTYTKDRRGIPL